MTARIFTAARARLLDIWEYTAEQWGEDQADRYVRGLVESIEQAGRSRHCWRAVPDEELIGVFFIRHAHHFIFFRELAGNTLGVISILHESMDMPARLREDAGRNESEQAASS